MNYRDALQSINTEYALQAIGFEYVSQGAYLKFDCECGAKRNIKSYGDKKNLWFCPSCKKGGNVISLVMAKKGMEYQEVKEKLLKGTPTKRKLTRELQLTYELQWTEKLGEIGLTEELCQKLEIGIPKGRSMLAGCVAFTIYNEGKKIAYYGIRIKDGRAVFHRSFNPECYLYNIDNIQDHAIFTMDMFECVLLINEGRSAVCNFGLPYLSKEQIKMLNEMESIEFISNTPEIVNQASQLKTFYRFK